MVSGFRLTVDPGFHHRCLSPGRLALDTGPELRAGRIFCLFVSLGLRCCMWSLSSCREQGFLSSGVDGLLLLQSMESRCMGFSKCGAWAWPSTAGGILLNQGLNLCLLHWQTDSYPPAKSRRVLLLMFSRGPPPLFSAMWQPQYLRCHLRALPPSDDRFPKLRLCSPDIRLSLVAFYNAPGREY